MKIAIIGAGIGGLTLALKLHQQGIDCEVFESVTALRPLGVGINTLPHAVRELDGLGLLPALREIAIETASLSYYNKLGQRIWSEPRGVAAGYPVPQFSVHRGELQMLLYRVACERLGAARIHTDCAFESLQQDAQGVTARLRDRAGTASREVRADVLVGADGIHSAVRRFFYPSGDPLRYSGRMFWRGVTEGAPFLDGRSMFMAGHSDQKFIGYPISEPLRREGRARINWIAELSWPSDTVPVTDWNKQVDKRAFAGRFAGWKWDWIDIPAIIDSAATIFELPLNDRDPLPRWTFGRATLLGDAAHPMYPNGSNGAAQAILDAAVLTDWLVQLRDGRVRDAHYVLREYEADRLPKTTGIVLRNRLTGPELCMELAEQRAPGGFADVGTVFEPGELEAISLRYKRLAGFDPASFTKPA
jgi:2-polyprenyl-6-methoxyphenol hydroxylase-like FAD-dependent oxidoreductase